MIAVTVKVAAIIVTDRVTGVTPPDQIREIEPGSLDA